MEEKTAKRVVVALGIFLVLLGLTLLTVGFFFDALLANISIAGSTKTNSFPFSFLTPLLGVVILFAGVLVLRKMMLGYRFALAIPPLLFLFVVFDDLNATFRFFMDSSGMFQQPTSSLILHVIEELAMRFHADPVTGAYSIHPLYFCYFLVAVIATMLYVVLLRPDVKSLFTQNTDKPVIGGKQ